MPSEPAKQPRWRLRSAFGTVAVIIALVVFGAFAWRVAHYARLIRSGNLTLEDLDFGSDYTQSDTLAALPPLEGDIDVVGEGQPFLGEEGAPVTIVEFADYGCPYSRRSSFTMRALAGKFGDRVHYVYRDFPVDELHPEARRAAEAAECAREQDRFWEYHDKLYQNQTSLSEDAYGAFARALGLDVNLFTSCMRSGRHATGVQEDYEAGLEAGVRGTPTFFVNGALIPGAIPEDVLDRLILQVLSEEDGV